LLLEKGKPLPTPDPDALAPDADLVELIPLSVHAGVSVANAEPRAEASGASE
jgi:hypothetical protein